MPATHSLIPFPPVSHALREPNGLLAVGGDLSPERLLMAYQQGIFPWFNADEPILWWSPDPRMVLHPHEFRLHRSLAKTLRRHVYEIRVDSAFAAVIRACAAPRSYSQETWIQPSMQMAYQQLHELGFAHSVETWVNGELVGGLYGVALGGVFFGESMFSHQRDGSKIALAHLAYQLQRWGFSLIDCQMHTPHLASLGAAEISRTDFLQRLQHALILPPRLGKWRFDHDLFA